MNQHSIFQRAIFAHAKWKYHLRQAIESGTSGWTVAEVKQDNRCDLGDWIESLPASEKKTDRYFRLKALHADFHDAASEVLALALAGKKSEAREAMSLGSRFAKVSTKLTLTLSEWAKSDAQQAAD